ncbi:hypothetical protein DERP_011119 [Dermatophagoides pteronyssinus]|uniref:Uncharacterized protein n=1 Tax=Dermatophagoides pteronyssinus TaxID=6956 RepID=A0ABQ8J8V0_DERPT|nr:hypothetical protein DERP_011119 [Dermatophagoides pteronyssinus]
MDEILMKFKHSSSSSSSNIEWPDYLESKRSMVINLIEKQMKLMIQLNEQNLLHKELVRTIFTQKNVEQIFFIIIFQKDTNHGHQYDRK